MQQKEVLIIVGVLVVGFFLLNNNGMLSGQATMNDNIITSPQGYKADTNANLEHEPTSDMYPEESTLGVGASSETVPCPGRKTLQDANCARWVNNLFQCRNPNGGSEIVPCHCGRYDSCTPLGPFGEPLAPSSLTTASINALNNMGEFYCQDDNCDRLVSFQVVETHPPSPSYADLCILVTKEIRCVLKGFYTDT